MNGNIIIRKYNLKDRQALRELCCNVADRGESIESLFFDRDMAADLLTGYYTDYDPASSFIAESNGRLVGYVNACLDNRRYGLAMMFFVIPLAVLKAFVRGVFFRREFWKSINVYVRNWPRLLQWRKESFHSHQGHVHIGIEAPYRRQHVGEQLLSVLTVHAKLHGLHALGASVHSANTAACRFFERIGFHREAAFPMVLFRKNTVEEYESIYYVKNI